MTKNEAAEILAYLTSANLRFAPRPIDPAAFAVWADHLRSVPFAQGAEAARQVVAEDTEWPTPARFREVWRAVKRAEDAHRPALTEGGQPVSPVSPEQARENIRQLRKMLAAHPVKRT